MHTSIYRSTEKGHFTEVEKLELISGVEDTLLAESSKICKNSSCKKEERRQRKA